MNYLELGNEGLASWFKSDELLLDDEEFYFYTLVEETNEEPRSFHWIYNVSLEFDKNRRDIVENYAYWINDYVDTYKETYEIMSGSVKIKKSDMEDVIRRAAKWDNVKKKDNLWRVKDGVSRLIKYFNANKHCSFLDDLESSSKDLMELYKHLGILNKYDDLEYFVNYATCFLKWEYELFNNKGLLSNSKGC